MKTPVGPDYPDIHFPHIDIIRKLEAGRRAVVCRPGVGVCFHLSISLSKSIYLPWAHKGQAVCRIISPPPNFRISQQRTLGRDCSGFPPGSHTHIFAHIIWQRTLKFDQISESASLLRGRTQCAHERAQWCYPPPCLSTTMRLLRSPSPSCA